MGEAGARFALEGAGGRRSPGFSSSGESEAAGKGREKVCFPDVSAGRAAAAAEPGGCGERAERRAAGARSLPRPAPATPPAIPGPLAGMDSAAAAAFALDKPALGPGPPPPPPPALGPGDCAQARKNFTVSHLLDLEEVAAAGRLAARPAARAEAREGAAREPSGGSSGSEAAPQDGECGRARGAGPERAWERRGAGGARGAGGTGGAPGRPDPKLGSRRGGRTSRDAAAGQPWHRLVPQPGLGCLAVVGALRCLGLSFGQGRRRSYELREVCRLGAQGGGGPRGPAPRRPGRRGDHCRVTAGETEASEGQGDRATELGFKLRAPSSRTPPHCC